MEHDPVPAFAALAHPQRLAVVTLLSRRPPAPVAAGEIGGTIGVKPSTLSGYLAQLVEAGLITQERRGTSLLYRLATDGMQRLNEAWIGGICQGRGMPDLWVPGPRIRNLLFLGRRNAGPTLIAEAVFRARAGEHYEVFSAGVDPVATAPADVIDLLARQGYDTELLWSKPVGDLLAGGGPRMDVVITLGESALRAAPIFPGCPVHAHWRLPAGLSAEALHDALTARLEGFAGLDPAVSSRAAIQAGLDHAGAALA